jgi:hypothetical protein
MLAHFGKDGILESVVPKISQETLAEMVGTTRSRVNFFMNRFRKLGLIDYAGGAEGGLQVHSALLNVVLHHSSEPYNPDRRPGCTGIRGTRPIRGTPKPGNIKVNGPRPSVTRTMHGNGKEMS